MGISTAHKCYSAVSLLIVTLDNQVLMVYFILAANFLTFLNCNSCSTILKIFKAKIYPTNDQQLGLVKLLAVNLWICSNRSIGVMAEY